jgi:hypothetical protein
MRSGAIMQSGGGIGRLGHPVKRSGPLRITAGSAESQRSNVEAPKRRKVGLPGGR